MSAGRARKILLAALAISLLVHLLLAGYIRWPIFGQSREEPVAKVRILRIARRTPPPPPTPAPTPVPTPAATPMVHASIAPPPVTPRGNKGVPHVQTVPVPAHTPTVRATATAAPTPMATATAAAPCGGHANAEPTVASTPDVADITPEARASKISGTAAIHVVLDPQGHVTDASVAQSSGNAGLDATAMQMARSATYTPHYVDCKPVAGAYTFTVKFVAW
jgi:TonB family protein